MNFSILHISDLHRDLQNEVGNSSLLESLIRDVEQRYGSNVPPITKPALCIVSGDLVYGAKRGSFKFADELKRQYDQAIELLIGIAEAFLHGDRQRIIIVPGNHDVSYNHVLQASQPVAIPTSEVERAKLVTELFEHATQLRWSWSDLCFYRIVDPNQYADRLRDFAKAYSDFYQGSRNFSLDPRLQYDFFDYPDLNFTVLGLSSCHRNDPLNRIASIHPAALANAIQTLREARYSGRTVAAVWHHSLFGTPVQNDYIDSEMLLHLIDAGVSLGFHGHQHRAQCIEERHQVAGSGRKISIISASTLCAGPSQLSPGEPRGYNVVEVDTEVSRCCVHRRRMHNNDFSYPIWAPDHFVETGEFVLNMKIDPPLRLRPQRLDAALMLEKAEHLIGSRSWKEAVDLLSGISHDSVGRSLLAKALSEYGDSSKTIELLWPPTSVAETVQLGGAILSDGSQQHAADFLKLDIVNSGTDASVREIARRLRERHAR